RSFSSFLMLFSGESRQNSCMVFSSQAAESSAGCFFFFLSIILSSSVFVILFSDTKTHTPISRKGTCQLHPDQPQCLQIPWLQPSPKSSGSRHSGQSGFSPVFLILQSLRVVILWFFAESSMHFPTTSAQECPSEEVFLMDVIQFTFANCFTNFPYGTPFWSPVLIARPKALLFASQPPLPTVLIKTSMGFSSSRFTVT